VDLSEILEDLYNCTKLFGLQAEFRGANNPEDKSLLSLLVMTRKTYCKSPLDIIFALLGLADNELSRSIEVDYNITPASLYIRLALCWFRLERNLDILNCCGPPTRIRVRNLPS
jgi:hypothetical protein